MPLCDHFSAADDESAVAALRTEGGPTRTDHDTVCLKGIDPVVALARHAHATGRRLYCWCPCDPAPLHAPPPPTTPATPRTPAGPTRQQPPMRWAPAWCQCCTASGVKVVGPVQVWVVGVQVSPLLG